MIIEKIGEGDTIEQARENARKLLAAPENAEVKFDVVQVPQKKVLGLFGGKKAQVKAHYEIKDPKPAKKPAKVKEQKTEKKPVAKKVEPKKPIAKSVPKQVKSEKTEKKRIPLGEDRIKKAQNDCTAYTKVILEKMLEREISVDSRIEKDDTIYICVDSKDHDVDGMIIGRRGETLDAVQYLASLVANKGHDDYARVTLDVANYREKRETTLVSLAHRNANNVLRSGRRITLEPMNPYERHIIHTAVQDIEGVTSHSIGTGVDRRVVISLKDGVRPQGGDRRRTDSRNFERRPRQQAVSSPSADRQPKKDVASAPLYGIVTKGE